MSTLPDSLRRILAAQAPAAVPVPRRSVPDFIRRPREADLLLAAELGITTFISRSGSVWRMAADGSWRHVCERDPIS